ncbi:MAG TPA: response regulator [Blastocatellia bacterium]|nr:response regulator [Blastocatellia bacterium]
MKLRALVVDDSRVMRGIVMNSLRKTGLAEFEFTEAENGSDAIAKFQPDQIDILFVDWNMPQMSGIDFVRLVRAGGKTEHIPVVMVTSEKTKEKVDLALQSAGANAYITKPFTPEEMLAQLSKLMSTMTVAS